MGVHNDFPGLTRGWECVVLEAEYIVGEWAAVRLGGSAALLLQT